MGFVLEIVEPDKLWKILDVADEETAADTVIGTVERLSTGYMVTLFEPPGKVKRFRMVDALAEALGTTERIPVRDPS